MEADALCSTPPPRCQSFISRDSAGTGAGLGALPLRLTALFLRFTRALPRLEGGLGVACRSHGGGLRVAIPSQVDGLQVAWGWLWVALPGSRASTSASDCRPDRALSSARFFGDSPCGWGWLIESSRRKGIACKSAGGELQAMRYGQKET